MLFSYLTHLLTDNSFLYSPSVIRHYVKSWQFLGDVVALFEVLKGEDHCNTVAATFNSTLCKLNPWQFKERVKELSQMQEKPTHPLL